MSEESEPDNQIVDLTRFDNTLDALKQRILSMTDSRTADILSSFTLCLDLLADQILKLEEKILEKS